METVRVEIQDGIARITLNRPEVRNAFNETLIRELSAAFTDLGPEVRVVILTGEGKAFCAGADLKWMQQAVWQIPSRIMTRKPTKGMVSRFMNTQPGRCLLLFKRRYKLFGIRHSGNLSGIMP